VEAASVDEDVGDDARMELADSERARPRQWPVALAFGLALVLYVPYGFGLYKLISALV
jgi:hypothetical protein